MGKTKYKLEGKKFALAIITTFSLIFASNTIYNELFNNNDTELLTEEEIQMIEQQESFKNENEVIGNDNLNTIGYTLLGLISLGAIGSGVCLYNSIDKNTSVIGSKIQRRF